MKTGQISRAWQPSAEGPARLLPEASLCYNFCALDGGHKGAMVLPGLQREPGRAPHCRGFPGDRAGRRCPYIRPVYQEWGYGCRLPVKAAAGMTFLSGRPVDDDLKIFTGNSHPALANAVCNYLNLPLGQAEVFKFANDNSFVRILENVRQRDVFIVQPTGFPVNDNLMELLIMIDAFKRSSAGRITAVIPYYGYGRTDKKDQPRVPITARLVADLLTTAGADRLLTVDLHAGQIQGFFNIPVDELTAETILAEYFKAKEINDLVVVAVDIGISKRARDVAEYLDVPLAIIEKRRIGNADHSETLNVIGDVRGKVALTFDDEILTGGTTVNAGQALLDCGVTRVYCCATHPVFARKAYNLIAESSFEEVVVTDTLPLIPGANLDKVKVLSIAPLLGEAISRIHYGQSVGELFSARS